MSDKVDFRPKNTTRDRERGRYYKNAGKVHPEDIAILNGCAPNHRAAKHVRQKLTELKREID